ncbi:MAG TPA: PH domain-containing protein [Sphingomicrobium sp.]|nr:PH domain-containing protein [Sphingomicrobium sp.]
MPPGGEVEPPLQSVEPAYRHVLRARLAVSWLVLLLISLILDRALLVRFGFGGALPLAVLIAAILAVSIAPNRTYRRLNYRLTDRLLQVVRGWLFHVDTTVPLVRVQHIDIARGPLDKLFGTATLIVHTAGTHNSIVSLPGLSPERAGEIRDRIREHVRTDYG